MTRTHLLVATAESLRAAFPERADALAATLEARLSPGPWNLALPRPARRVPLLDVSRDTLLAETARALRGSHEEDAEQRIARLERWLRASVRDVLCSVLGAMRIGATAVTVPGIAPRSAERIEAAGFRAVIGWAGYALEETDSPSLRILAGLSESEAGHEHRGWHPSLQRSIVEMGWAPPGPAEEMRAYLRALALDVVAFRREPAAIARELAPLRWSAEQGVSPELDRLLEVASRIEYEGYHGAAIEETAREVAEELRTLLAAVPDPHGNRA